MHHGKLRADGLSRALDPIVAAWGRCYGEGVTSHFGDIHEKSPHPPRGSDPGRRRRRRGGVGSGLAGSAFAQGDDLAPYRAAKINWKQAEGESISVAVIPASYFENLISLLPQFEALTGIKVRVEKVPPGQIRQKAMLDLSSKTATYATHAADPMYYPLYVVEQVGRAARQVPRTTRRSPTRPGSTTTTSSRPGATPTRSTASPTASPTTAR